MQSGDASGGSRAGLRSPSNLSNTKFGDDDGSPHDKFEIGEERKGLPVCAGVDGLSSPRFYGARGVTAR